VEMHAAKYQLSFVITTVQPTWVNYYQNCSFTHDHCYQDMSFTNTRNFS